MSHLQWLLSLLHMKVLLIEIDRLHTNSENTLRRVVCLMLIAYYTGSARLIIPANQCLATAMVRSLKTEQMLGCLISAQTMERLGQLEAATHIRTELVKRGMNISPGSISILGGVGWLVFRRGPRSIGVDQGSGIWVREYEDGEWRCLAKPCTVSQVLLGVDFIAGE